jgi:hypothetical protein
MSNAARKLAGDGARYLRRHVSEHESGERLSATKDPARMQQQSEEDVRQLCVRYYRDIGFANLAECADALGASANSVQLWLTTGPRHVRIPAWVMLRLRDMAVACRPTLDHGPDSWSVRPTETR